MARRAATVLMKGPAGVVLVASFAMFRVLMTIFNAGRALPQSSGCWELFVMVETQGSHERVVRQSLRRERESLSR